MSSSYSRLLGKMKNNDFDENDKPLKALIEQAGYTQKEFAAKAGLGYSTIKFYVAKQKMPHLDSAALMCRALGISFKELCKAFDIDTSGIPDNDK